MVPCAFLITLHYTFIAFSSNMKSRPGVEPATSRKHNVTPLVLLVQHGTIAAQSPCRPLFLSRGMTIPSDLGDFPLANSCGNGTYVFEIS
jgi:hypothetical protein